MKLALIIFSFFLVGKSAWAEPLEDHSSVKIVVRGITSPTVDVLNPETPRPDRKKRPTADEPPSSPDFTSDTPAGGGPDFSSMFGKGGGALP